MPMAVIDGMWHDTSVVSNNYRGIVVTRRPHLPAHGAFRFTELLDRGVGRNVIRRLMREGKLQRVARGLYVPAHAPVTEHHSLVEATTQAPRGIVCLLSALQFHGLTTQSPHDVWLAVDVKAWPPRQDAVQLHLVRMSGRSLSAGVERHKIEGRTVRVFSAAKTVVDCFKFRNKVGLDVALEALKDFRRTQRGKMDELHRLARICRMVNVMRPYLEATS